MSIDDSNNAPSEGERRAIAGYAPQYGLAATAALRMAKSGKLLAVRLCDPAASIADDYQLETDGRIDAHQVKWSGAPPAFRFKEFCDLIPDLVKGRTQLAAEHPTCRIVVHIVSNSLASVNDSVPVSGDKVGSFHDFWEDILEPSQRAEFPTDSAFIKWAKAIDDVQRRTGLASDEFRDFLRDLHVDLGTQLPTARPDVVGHREDDIRNIEAVAGYFFRSVRESQSNTVVELSAPEILREAGLADSLQFQNQHRFQSSSIPYRPLIAARDQLAELLTSNDKGYVALVGPPGAGKSTLINEEFRSPGVRVLKYFAFVPGGTVNSATRGESECFFHDMNLALVHHGSRVERSSSKTRIELRAEFLRHLHWLQSDFVATERRTVIFVDGLDHISREQEPERSLLKDLPLPDEIPAGVIFALGTQPAGLEELPNAIREELKQHDRIVDIARLTSEQVNEITAEMIGEKLASFHVQKKICELSEGHPLALAIVLRLLMDQEQSATTLMETLDSVELIGSDIDRHYETVWANSDFDDETIEFLGMTVRDRLPLSLDKAEASLGRGRAAAMLDKIGHLWQVDPSGRLHAFHNSLNLFLHRKTACNLLGAYEDSRSTQMHEKLAAAYLAEVTPALRWEAVYHLQQAGQTSSALRNVTLEFVRAQLEDFRAPDDLFGDIRDLMKLAVNEGDLPKLAELAIAWNELNLCELALGEFRKDMPELLLSCGQTQQALQMLMDGMKPRQPPAVCIEIATGLMSAGFRSEANRLFFAVEPLHALQSLTNINQDEEIKGLIAWARSVALFRRPEQAHHFITNASLHGFQNHHQQTVDELRRRLLAELAIGLEECQIESNVVDDVDTHLLGCDRRAWISLRSGRLEALKQSKGLRKELAEDTLSFYATIGSDDAEAWETLLVAEIAHFICGKSLAAKTLVESLKSLNSRDFSRYDQLSIRQRQWFRLSRLRAALAMSDLSGEIDTSDQNEHRSVDQQVTKQIAHLGTLVGKRRAGLLHEKELLREIRSAFRFLSQRSDSRISDDPYWTARVKRPEIMRLLLTSLSKDQAFGELVSAFEEMLNGLATGEKWTLKEREEALHVLCNVGARGGIPRSVLDCLEADWPIDAVTASESAPREFAFAKARISLGDVDACLAHMKTALAHLGTVDHPDDDQYEHWCQFLSLANSLDSDVENRRQRVSVMVRGASAASEGGCRSKGAAITAVKSATRLNAGYGKAVSEQLSTRGVVSFADSLGAFLSACVHRDKTVAPLATELMRYFSLAIDEPIDGAVSDVMRGIHSEDAYESLAQDVDVIGLNEYRCSWHSQIIEATQNEGLSPPQRSIDKAGKDPAAFNDSMKVSLGRDEELTVSEAMKVVNTPSDFRELRKNGTNSYELRTEALTAQLCNQFEESDVLELSEILIEHDQRGREIALCMDQLDALGNSKKAGELARHILANCGSNMGDSDWLWDGALLRAIKQLEKQISKAEVRELTLKALARYIGSDQRCLHRTGADLFGEILPRICTDEEVLLIADSVEGFVANASRFVDNDEALEPTDVAVKSALLEWLLEMLGHPVNFLADAARGALGSCLRSGVIGNADVSKICLLANEHQGAIEGLLAALFSAAETEVVQVSGTGHSLILGD